MSQPGSADRTMWLLPVRHTVDILVTDPSCWRFPSVSDAMSESPGCCAPFKARAVAFSMPQSTDRTWKTEITIDLAVESICYERDKPKVQQSERQLREKRWSIPFEDFRPRKGALWPVQSTRPMPQCCTIDLVIVVSERTASYQRYNGDS